MVDGLSSEVKRLVDAMTPGVQRGLLQSVVAVTTWTHEELNRGMALAASTAKDSASRLASDVVEGSEIELRALVDALVGLGAQRV